MADRHPQAMEAQAWLPQAITAGVLQVQQQSGLGDPQAGRGERQEGAEREGTGGQEKRDLREIIRSKPEKLTDQAVLRTPRQEPMSP